MSVSPGDARETTVAADRPNPPRHFVDPHKSATICSGGKTGSGGNDPRLHKPGVTGSSPVAASSLSINEAIADYHADKAWFSKSQLWDLIAQGPETFFARHISGTLHYRESHPSLERGTLVHQWAEDGDESWWSRVVAIPADALGAGGRRTKATEEFEKTLPPNAIVLKADEIDSYRQQFAKIKANAAFGDLTAATTQRECSIRWRDVSGLPLRCRPDAVTPSVVWDIKTTREAKPLDTFYKSVVEYGYAFQAVHYLAGCRAAGLDVRDFVFLVTSTVWPYRCHAVRLPQRLLDRAERQRRKTIAEVQMRMELDHWLPADSGEVTELFVPERYMEDFNGRRSRLPRVL